MKYQNTQKEKKRNMNIFQQEYYTLFDLRNIKYRIYDSLENTDVIMNNTFQIGVYPGLKEEHLKYILEKFNAFISKNKYKG